MSPCDDVREARFLGRALDAAAAAHAAACAGCRHEAGQLAGVRTALGREAAAGPPPDLRARVLARATPHLARNAERAAWATVARAVAAALLPLPLVLVLDAWVVTTAHAVLSRVLPETLSLWLVGNYVALLAFLLALTWTAVPIVAARQVRLVPEETHA